MAVAVQPSSPSRKPPEGASLAVSSALGAAVVLGIAAVVFRGVPWAWEQLAASAGINDALVRLVVQVTAQLAVAVALIAAAARAAGRGTLGVRGGTFFIIAAALVVFFAGRSLYLVSQRGFAVGNVVLMLFDAAVIVLVVQFFRTGRFRQWSVAVDEAGWFDAHTHKRTQGLRVRRLTMLGILAVAISGIWTLMAHDYLPQNTVVKVPYTATENGKDVTRLEERSNRLGDWVVGGQVLSPDTQGLPPEEKRARPRVDGGVTLLPDLQFTIPLILLATSLWFAWRVVNYPTFADFLIATEAEINKVSWTSRRALFRDTIVVLVSLFLMTLFLFVVDVFWGWVLSRPYIEVLPTEKERNEARAGADEAKPVTGW